MVAISYPEPRHRAADCRLIKTVPAIAPRPEAERDSGEREAPNGALPDEPAGRIGGQAQRARHLTTTRNETIMSAPQINPAFGSVLEPLGAGAGDLPGRRPLPCRQDQFSAAAAFAGLGFEEFHYRLKEHFGHGFIMDDETVLEDLRLADQLRQATSGSHAPAWEQVPTLQRRVGPIGPIE